MPLVGLSLLPLLGMEALGNVTEGILAWIITLAIIVIGVVGKIFNLFLSISIANQTEA